MSVAKRERYIIAAYIRSENSGSSVLNEAIVLGRSAKGASQRGEAAWTAARVCGVCDCSSLVSVKRVHLAHAAQRQ